MGAVQVVKSFASSSGRPSGPASVSSECSAFTHVFDEYDLNLQAQRRRDKKSKGKITRTTSYDD